MSKATAILFLVLALSIMAYINYTEKFGQGSTSDNVIVITGGRLLQGTGGKIIEDAVVVLEKGRIAHVFRRGEAEVPVGSQVIDARGCTLLPGFIDCQVSLLLGSAGAGTSAEEYMPDRVVRDLKASLYWGVTSIQSSGDSLAWMIRLRENEKSGSILSPRLRTSGPLLTSPGGYPARYLPLTVAQDSTRQLKDGSHTREVITTLADQKIDFLSIVYEGQTEAKPYPKLDLALFQQAIERAHELGLRATARVGSIRDLKDAIRAGIDAIELVTDEGLDDESLRLMRERGVYYISTLSPRLRDSQSAKDIRDIAERDDAQRTVSAGVRKGLASGKGYFFQLKADPETVKYMQDVWKASLKNISLAARNGVKIALGTGAGHPAVFYGLALHDELRLLTEAGLTAVQAIEAATGNAAQYLGVEASTGSLEPGKLADIVILDGNPLEDITRSRSVRYVIKGATIIDRERIFQ